MTFDSDTDTWYYNATCHRQCHVSHTGTWHVAFLLFFKIKKNLKKLKI